MAKKRELDEEIVTPVQSEDYVPSIVERYGAEYFSDRHENNPQRLAQFSIDSAFVKKFCSSGNLCDVGCSTGEFVNSLNWKGDAYGMEISESAKAVASKNGILFNKNIFTESDFFDVVIFRGTIQHVDEPFRMMKSAFKSLKKGGVIIFLAAPNSDSILYRMKLNLPFLSKHLNFYIPGERQLCAALENFGYRVESVEFPYWNTPYRHFLKDHFFFVLNIFSTRFFKHAFWKSSMSICARKI